MKSSQVPASAPLLVLDNVTRVFTTRDIETHALKDANIEISAGEYVAVSGPSGSGKSTLLSILGLLDVPTRGRYQLAGVEVSGLTRSARSRVRNERIGFIFQAFNLIDELTVAENVDLVLRYRGIARAQRRPRVEAALASVGMSHRARHVPSQLSGGQQQRVAVARAVVGEPSILLADEPTGNLDSHNGEAVMDLLDELHAAGTTICMVTHDTRYASRAKRAIKVLDGRIIDDIGRKRDALGEPQTTVHGSARP